MDTIAKYCLLLPAFFCLLLLDRTSAKLVHGNLITSSDQWQFLTKFCFAQSRGVLEYQFSYSADQNIQTFLMYYDEQWPLVYPNSNTCWEKQQVLNVSSPFNIVPLTSAFLNSGCTRLVNNGTDDMFQCGGLLKFSTARDRWWYFVVANCHSQRGLTLDFKLHMRNGEAGDIFFAEFSADEFYILPVDIMFLGMTCVVLGFSCFVGHLLNKQQLLHSTFKLFIVSLALECVHLLIDVIAYSCYAHTGFYPDGAITLAQVIGATGTVTFIMLLLLVALGYTITMGRLSTCVTTSLTVFISFYYLAYVLLYSIYYYTTDPGLVTYLFNSPNGYILVTLRLIAWCAFCVASLRTVYLHSRKRRFYTLFVPLFSIWFWAGPIIVFIAANYVDPWALQKIVNGLDLTVTFFGFLVFLVITRPTKANKNFPYHIRTCQISAMSELDAIREEIRIRNSDVPQEGINFDALFTVTTRQSDGTSPMSTRFSVTKSTVVARPNAPGCSVSVATLELEFCTRFGNLTSFPDSPNSPARCFSDTHEPVRITELCNSLHSVE